MMKINKKILFGIAIGGVTLLAVYKIGKESAKKELEEEKENSEVDDNGNPDGEPESTFEEKKDVSIKERVKEYAVKGLTWAVTNKDYLEAGAMVFSFATSVVGFKKAIMPVKPKLTTDEVKDCVKTSLDGYLETQKDYIKTQGLNEFLDDVVDHGEIRMRNKNSGAKVLCKMVTEESK